MFVVDVVASGFLRYHSFHFHRNTLAPSVFPLRPLTLFTTHRSPAKALTYWHRPHTAKTKLPILFIHGIGIGLYPYVDFLADISTRDDECLSEGQVGIIAVEIMSVSFRITGGAIEKEQMCDEVRCILTAHGWDKFVLVCHS